MSVPVWSLLAFVLSAAGLGIGFWAIVEEVCSASRAILRYHVVVGLVPLAILGMIFMGLLRHYLAESLGLVVITTIGLLAVHGFALGVGLLVSLRTYRDHLSPSGKSWVSYMLVYLLAGIALPLLSMVNGVISLQGHAVH